MALTSIKTKWKDEKEVRLQFLTIPAEKGLYVAVHTCNEEWKPVGPPSESVDERTEEQYHKDLRKESSEKGEYVKEYSTNPEWNPGYITPKEE